MQKAPGVRNVGAASHATLSEIWLSSLTYHTRAQNGHQAFLGTFAQDQWDIQMAVQHQFVCKDPQFVEGQRDADSDLHRAMIDKPCRSKH